MNAHAFVAGFIGSPAMNLFETEVVDGAVRLGRMPVDLPDELHPDLTACETVTVGIRPEHRQLGDVAEHQMPTGRYPLAR